MWISVHGSRKLRGFTPWFNTLRGSKGAGRQKSGALKSWLEATPTELANRSVSYTGFRNNLWERHLAAICEHFEPTRNTAMSA